MGTARRLAGGALVFAAASCAAASAEPGARPAVGRHTAELCVATSAAPPSCGPALADVRAGGAISVRVDDVVYHLKLHSSQVDVVVMHNVVQIDEMTVPYEWAGATLKFTDDERGARYEVRFTPAGKGSKS